MIIIIILMLLNAIFAIAQSTKPFTRNTRALAKVILIREPLVFVLSGPYGGGVRTNPLHAVPVANKNKNLPIL